MKLGFLLVSLDGELREVDFFAILMEFAVFSSWMVYRIFKCALLAVVLCHYIGLFCPKSIWDESRSGPSGPGLSSAMGDTGTPCQSRVCQEPSRSRLKHCRPRVFSCNITGALPATCETRIWMKHGYLQCQRRWQDPSIGGFHIFEWLTKGTVRHVFS